MDLLARLGLLFGLSFVSGVNLYATIAVVGLCVKHHLVAGLPPELSVLANDGVIALAIFLYVIEFVMDKVPGLDTLWDALHTLIRPVGGAFLGLLLAGESSPVSQVLAFMTGAWLASMAHATKAGTRLVINASPEPFSNFIVSVGEDLGVIGLTYLALAHPLASLVIVVTCLVGIMMLLPFLFRGVRMFLSGVFHRVKGFVGAKPGEREALGFWISSRGAEWPSERVIWSGVAYAVKVPHVPKFRRVEIILTAEALHLHFKYRMRKRELILASGRMLGSGLFPGGLFSRWVLRNETEEWHLYLTRALADTLPKEAFMKGRFDEKPSMGR